MAMYRPSGCAGLRFAPGFATALRCYADKPVVETVIGAQPGGRSSRPVAEFSFILAGLGVNLGLLPKHGRDFILAGAILSIIANPLLFVALDRWQSKRASEAMLAPPSDKRRRARTAGPCQ